MIEVSGRVYQDHVDRVMADEGQMHDHNPVCPFCGHEGSLRAEVESYHVKVPLWYDGYVITDGSLMEDEIKKIECVDCKREVPVEHYWHSKEECRCAITACVQRVVAWLDEGEE